MFSFQRAPQSLPRLRNNTGPWCVCTQLLQSNSRTLRARMNSSLGHEGFMKRRVTRKFLPQFKLPFPHTKLLLRDVQQSEYFYYTSFGIKWIQAESILGVGIFLFISHCLKPPTFSSSVAQTFQKPWPKMVVSFLILFQAEFHLK